jgi:lysophospholipase L1-like esterase
MKRRLSMLCTLAAILLAAACGGEKPSEVHERTAAPPANEGNMETVVILGASYAAGWHPGATDEVRFVNSGVGGEQSHEMLARFDEDVLQLQPRAVILWGYINDIHRSGSEGMEETKARARRSFEEMVELARANGIEPVLATEVTLRGKNNFKDRFATVIGRLLGKQSYQDRVNGHVLELNGWLRDYAGKNGLLLLDLQPVLSDKNDRRLKEYAQEDGSHITAAGYEALTAHFEEILERHFSSE